MFCPDCKCEYIRGVTECAECGVLLVDTLESLDANPSEDDRIVAIWRGSDPAECDRIKEALEISGIPFTAPDAKSYFSFLPTEPTMEIWISETDREKARKLIFDLEGRTDPDELTPEEIESLALPESDRTDSEDQTSQLQEQPENWYEEQPVTEIWSGDSEVLAKSLIACLREIGIGSHKLSEAGHLRLVVRTEQQSRAREVVREVVEASPPE